MISTANSVIELPNSLASILVDWISIGNIVFIAFVVLDS